MSDSFAFDMATLAYMNSGMPKVRVQAFIREWIEAHACPDCPHKRDGERCPCWAMDATFEGEK